MLKCTVHGVTFLYIAAWTILTFNIFVVRWSASKFSRTCIKNYSCYEIKYWSMDLHGIVKFIILSSNRHNGATNFDFSYIIFFRTMFLVQGQVSSGNWFFLTSSTFKQAERATSYGNCLLPRLFLVFLCAIGRLTVVKKARAGAGNEWVLLLSRGRLGTRQI